MRQSCQTWSNFSKAESRLNASLMRTFGEEATFNPTGSADVLTVMLAWPTPDQQIGNADSPRPRPYLMMKTSDLEGVSILPRDEVTLRGRTFTVVSDCMDDGHCLTMVYIRGDL